MTMSVEELNEQIEELVAERDARLEILRAQSSAAEAAQATAGDSLNPAIAAAEADHEAAVARDAAASLERDAALDEAALTIDEIGPIRAAPPDQSGNIAAVPS